MLKLDFSIINILFQSMYKMLINVKFTQKIKFSMIIFLTIQRDIYCWLVIHIYILPDI